jgi:hypothetical protein
LRLKRPQKAAKLCADFCCQTERNSLAGPIPSCPRARLPPRTWTA